MLIRALWTGASGMRAQQQNIDAIAHDLTNVNTNGYKKRVLNFKDLFYQSVRAAGLQGGADGNNVPVGVEIGSGVRLAGTTPVFTVGNPQETQIWSDAMINDNNSFFSVTMADGTTGYTRDGSFRVNNDGEMQTTDGLSLNPPITGLPADAIDPQISPSGQVQYRDAGGNTVTLGQIQLFQFINPAGLKPVGDSLWLETDASGAPNQGLPDTQGFGALRGGWVETSNVDAITEMVNMISAQRSYEFNSRSIQTSDEMLQTVNQLKR